MIPIRVQARMKKNWHSNIFPLFPLLTSRFMTKNLMIMMCI